MALEIIDTVFTSIINFFCLIFGADLIPYEVD